MPSAVVRHSRLTGSGCRKPGMTTKAVACRSGLSAPIPMAGHPRHIRFDVFPLGPPAPPYNELKMLSNDDSFKPVGSGVGRQPQNKVATKGCDARYAPASEACRWLRPRRKRRIAEAEGRAKSRPFRTAGGAMTRLLVICRWLLRFWRALPLHATAREIGVRVNTLTLKPGLRSRKHVGPDSLEMPDRIECHGKDKSANKERRQLIEASSG